MQAHKALGLRHYSRADFIVAPNGIYILEINTLPGLTSTSLFQPLLLQQIAHSENSSITLSCSRSIKNKFLVKFLQRKTHDRSWVGCFRLLYLAHLGGSGGWVPGGGAVLVVTNPFSALWA